MPINVAASRSCAVARITRPACVHFMKATSARVSVTAITDATTWVKLKVVEPAREHGREMPGPDEPEVAGPGDQRDVLEHGRQTDRGEDLDVVRGVDDPAHDQRVDDEADDEEQRDRHQHHEVGVRGEQHERPEGQVHPEHQELAVGEVDHPHDAEDQREPDRDQGVDPPSRTVATTSWARTPICAGPRRRAGSTWPGASRTPRATP